jgi:signal transduction histidine kinase
MASKKMKSENQDTSKDSNRSLAIFEHDQNLDPAKLLLLLNASKALASTTNLDELLNIIVSEVQNIIECEGAGVLLYDEERDDFYWRTVQDKQSFLASAREEIRIPRDRGVCGWVFTTGKPALVHDAANDPRIYRQVEDKSGFQTRNMVCIPLLTSEKILGALYALNKTHGSFTEDDVEILSALSSNITLALENASYLERLTNSNIELQRMNRAKDKMLHHLSHELKTPLAIIDASLSIMKKKVDKSGLGPEQFPFERILRNVDRLRTIEKQVVHIVEGKEYPEKGVIIRFMSYLDDFLDIRQSEDPLLKDALESLRSRILSLFPEKKEESESADIRNVLETEQAYTNRMKQDRDIEIVFEIPDPIFVNLPPQIVTSVIRGLIRNAVENTPDMGRIEVRVQQESDGYNIIVKDYGVGIPLEDQPNVFEGFYPIQETDFYTSGRPYGFNAGGTGTDLLKIRIFSERLGFNIRFDSSRCSCIPTSRDICPGNIHKCSCCARVEDCFKNGGTEFVVHIPSNLIREKHPDS